MPKKKRKSKVKGFSPIPNQTINAAEIQASRECGRALSLFIAKIRELNKCDMVHATYIATMIIFNATDELPNNTQTLEILNNAYLRAKQKVEDLN